MYKFRIGIYTFELLIYKQELRKLFIEYTNKELILPTPFPRID